MQRLEEDVRHLAAEKHEHEGTIIEQQDHIEKLQDSCRELQEAAQALQQDSDLKYAASIAQMKTERKQQVEWVSASSASYASEFTRLMSMQLHAQDSSLQYAASISQMQAECQQQV